MMLEICVSERKSGHDLCRAMASRFWAGHSGVEARENASRVHQLYRDMHVGDHLVVRPWPCPNSRLRDGGEWGRKGCLKAGSGLCELGSSSRWPPWRRCFGVRGDGCDALLVALKFMGAVEAGALMDRAVKR